MKIIIGLAIIIIILASWYFFGDFPSGNNNLPKEPSVDESLPVNDGVNLDKECRSTGCSGQVCADEDVITTCEARKEYACFKQSVCERQADGQCGWRETDELKLCLNNLK